MELRDIPIKGLMDIAFDWAYRNDRRLYENMDDIFSAHACRGRIEVAGVEIEGWRDIKKAILNEPNFFVGDLFQEALTKSDYYTTYKFNWTFFGSGNRDHEYAYKFNTEHAYVFLKPLITMRLKELAQLGLDDWRKSNDLNDNSHFRYWIKRTMEIAGEKYASITLFGTEYDTSRVELNLCRWDDETFNPVLQYVLDNHIIPDPHGGRKDISISSAFERDYSNRRILRSSWGSNFANAGFFHLTAAELADCYKNKIKRSRLSEMEKHTWAYINSVAKNKDNLKFYFYIH